MQPATSYPPCVKRAACIVLGAIATLIGALIFLVFGAVLLIAYELGGDVDPAGLAEVIGGTLAGAALGAWGVWLIARGGRPRVKTDIDEPNRDSDGLRPAH
jgi:hypothetical protein